MLWQTYVQPRLRNCQNVLILYVSPNEIFMYMVVMPYCKKFKKNKDPRRNSLPACLGYRVEVVEWELQSLSCVVGVVERELQSGSCRVEIAE